jgi:hypothetical protein
VNEIPLDTPKPKGVESSETEMWSATDELSGAIKSARAYVDDEKPSELADYKKHWDQGRAWWNQAVTAIWQAAGQPAPTIDNAPTAPARTPRKAPHQHRRRKNDRHCRRRRTSGHPLRAIVSVAAARTGSVDPRANRGAPRAPSNGSGFRQTVPGASQCTARRSAGVDR